MVAFENRQFIGGVSVIGYALLAIILFLVHGSVMAKEQLEVRLTQSAQKVWQRQQLLITLEVTTNDPFSRLEIGGFNPQGFEVISYQQQRIEAENKIRLTAKWVLFSFIAGKQKLQLPRIRYRPNRGRIQTLETQQLSLQVMRLPLYVPPTMPVGIISLKNKWSNGMLVTTNNLLEWEIEVSGEGVAPASMPPLIRQIKNATQLQILPLQKSPAVNKTASGITNQHTYKIPFKALHNGSLNFPSVEVQYFDPVEGKLQKTSLSTPFVLSLNKWLVAVIGLFLLLFTAWLVIKLIKYLMTVFKKTAQQKDAMRKLSNATSYQQLRMGLNELSLLYGWGDNLPLSEFLKQYQQQTGDSARLASAIKVLQESRFSKEGDSKINNISQLLIKKCEVST